MDLWAVHVKNTTGITFPLRNSSSEKTIPWNLRKMVSYRAEDGRVFEIKVSRRRGKASANQSFVVRALGKKNNDSSNPSSSPGNGDHSVPEGDGLKGNNFSSENSKSKANGSQKSHQKTLDWREFRAILYDREQQIAYEYAKKRANLVLVARREFRLRGISENARRLGARNVLIMGADVVKEDDCRIFVSETINYFGRVDHLVNAASLGHTFYFEEASDASVFPILMDINFWGNVYPTYVALPHLRQSHGRIIVNASVENWLPLPRMSLYSAAKAALVNFYETLRLEVKDDVGVTIATHGWIGADITGGKLMLEEGAEMQWKEEREVHASGGPVEEFARLIVAGACRGDPYVKYPSWYDIFHVYRVFAPNVLNWTFRLVFANNGTRRTSFIGTGARPFLESPSPSPRKLLTGPTTFSTSPVHHQLHRSE